MRPSILPKPRKLKELKGRFEISRETPLVLSPSCDSADRFAAGRFAEEIDSRASILPVVEKHGRLDGLGRCIVLMRMEDAGHGGFPEPPVDRKTLGAEGYFLEVKPDRVLLAAVDSRGIYYGLQTASQVLELRPGKASLSCVQVVDWPEFAGRGLLLDVSSGMVPTVETVQEIIERAASLKMNSMQLYIEHTFAFRRHPDIGRGTSPFTHDEIMHLDEHARRHHVDLQPNLQSLGNMTEVLSLPKYRHLAESDSLLSLCPTEAATYAFLDQIYSEFLPCFGSRQFNANCDRGWEIGEGRSAEAVRELGLPAVFAKHVLRLRALAGKYGKTTSMWADFLGNEAGILAQLPKDVLLFFTGEGVGYEAGCRAIEQAKLYYWIAPDSFTADALFPRVDAATREISGMAASGSRHGASGLLCTDWGIGPIGLGMHVHAFAAEVAWSGSSKWDADFDKRFSWQLARDKAGYIGKIFRTLSGTNAAFDPDGESAAPHSLFWARFPEGIEKKGLSLTALTKAEKVAGSARLQIAASRQFLPDQRLLLNELDLSARQTIFAVMKARVALAIHKDMPKIEGEAGVGFGGKALPKSLMTDVAVLLREWKLLRDEFERLWMARARRSEIETMLRLYKNREQEFARLATPADIGMRPPER